MGSQSAAFSLYSLHSSALRPQHSSLLVHLRSITLEDHLATDDLVQRFRSERFVLKMSQTVFGLLLGWLTDGTGPIAGAGSAEGVGGDGAEAPATRGRLAMLRIINERCRIEGMFAVNGSTAFGWPELMILIVHFLRQCSEPSLTISHLRCYRKAQV